MAIEIPYDGEIKEEHFVKGLFVYSNPLGNGYRIKEKYVGLNNDLHATLLDSSVYQLIEKEFNLVGKTKDKSLICLICDTLNHYVRIGLITLTKRGYIVK